VNPSHHVVLTVPSTHPTLPGHFPGRPVVPGAIILTEVVHAVAAFLPAARVTGFMSVKFASPMLPEQRCNLTLTDKGNGSIAFEILHGERRVASGQLRCEIAGAGP
jgi:3-hydroxymyristoyl/3-hydroxydecanoyl-(acyl carrier protein) dehydratase